jgi:hypothetical protein
MNKKLVFLLFSVFVFCSQVFAQNKENPLKLTAEASQSEMLLGDFIEVTFAFEGKQNGKFVAPDWENAGFDVQGPSQSSNFSMINGVTKSSISYKYYAQPRDTGVLHIPPAKFIVGKEEIFSETLEIRVLENINGNAPESKPKKRELDFWGRPLPETTPKEAPKKKRATTRI